MYETDAPRREPKDRDRPNLDVLYKLRHRHDIPCSDPCMRTSPNVHHKNSLPLLAVMDIINSVLHRCSEWIKGIPEVAMPTSVSVMSGVVWCVRCLVRVLS